MQWLRRFSYALGSAPHKGLRKETAGLKFVRLPERRLRKNQRAAQRQRTLYPRPLNVPSTVSVLRLHIILRTVLLYGRNRPHHTTSNFRNRRLPTLKRYSPGAEISALGSVMRSLFMWTAPDSIKRWASVIDGARLTEESNFVSRIGRAID